jgi:hypothetical protein
MDPIIHIGDGVAAAELDDGTMVMIWQHPATHDRWEWQVQLMEKMAAKPGDGFLMLNIIFSTSSPPPSSLRKRMQDYMKRIAPRMSKIVVVALGDSIWLSVVRTIIRALALISGESERQVVMATLHEGIAVMNRLGSRVPASEMKRAIDLATEGLGMHKARRSALS